MVEGDVTWTGTAYVYNYDSDEKKKLNRNKVNEGRTETLLSPYSITLPLKKNIMYQKKERNKVFVNYIHL